MVRNLYIDEIILTIKHLEGSESLFNENMIDSIRDINILYETLKETSDKKDFIKAKEKALYDLKIAEENNIKVVNIFDDLYPSTLKKSTEPPILLYYKGAIDFLNKMSGITVIGTRTPLKISEDIAYTYSKYLVGKGLYIISGLAKGIDTKAHLGAIDGSGKTVAFVPYGLNTEVYPKENEILAEEIVSSGGAVISEVDINKKAETQFFIDRDRLQSGLGKAVIVVETTNDGGTMIAGNDAIKLNKKVGVVWHKDTMDNDCFSGNIELIGKKSQPIFDFDDIDQLLVSL